MSGCVCLRRMRTGPNGADPEQPGGHDRERGGVARSHRDRHCGQCGRKSEYKQLKKDGLRFDPDRGEGIPTTTRNFAPKNQSVARQRTGAPNAEYQVDIDVTDLPRGPTTNMRSNLPEYPIRGDIGPERIMSVRRLPK